MTQKVLLVLHQENSDPGRIGQMLSAQGWTPELRRPALGDALPTDFTAYAGAVVFGGPMSANDDHLPFIRQELAWIPRWVGAGKPFLGICLGAQLLARSQGAVVAPHPRGLQEIGYYPLRPTPAGAALFDDGLHVYQFHREGFALPPGGELLARGESFPNQAFRLGPRVYGLQFHPEVTPAIMRHWVSKAPHRLTAPGAQSEREQESGAERYDAAIARWTQTFLRRWLGDPGAATAASAAATAPLTGTLAH